MIAAQRRRLGWRHLLRATMALAVALPLASSGAQARALTPADLPARLSPSARQEIERLADSLRGAQLPSDPVYAKAAEGVLKGAEEARILAAVRRLAHALEDARTALGAASTEAELVAGAGALQRGVPGAALRRLREAAGGSAGADGTLATPLVMLADLLTRRVPLTIAVAAIDSLVTRHAPVADFATLRAAVERDIDAGRSPDAATVLRTRSLLEALDSRRLVPERERPRRVRPHD